MFCFTRVVLCAVSLFCIGESQASEAGESSTTRILYIRHGEVPGNDPNPSTYIYTGCGTDSSLTKKGQAQAEQCAKDIALLQSNGTIGKVSAIYSSYLKRAVETAQPIADELGLGVEPRYNLREISWGCADGQLVQKMTEEWGNAEKQIKQQYPDRKIRWDYLPVFEGAETYNALLARSLEELKMLAERHPGETIIVVGHGRVLKTLIADAKDSEENIPYPANCGIAEFTYSLDVGVRFVRVI